MPHSNGTCLRRAFQHKITRFCRFSSSLSISYSAKNNTLGCLIRMEGVARKTNGLSWGRIVHNFQVTIWSGCVPFWKSSAYFKIDTEDTWIDNEQCIKMSGLALWRTIQTQTWCQDTWIDFAEGSINLCKFFVLYPSGQKGENKEKRFLSEQSAPEGSIKAKSQKLFLHVCQRVWQVLFGRADVGPSVIIWKSFADKQAPIKTLIPKMIPKFQTKKLIFCSWHPKNHSKLSSTSDLTPGSTTTQHLFSETTHRHRDSLTRFFLFLWARCTLTCVEQAFFCN